MHASSNGRGSADRVPQNLRRIWNPPNPFLTEHRELFEPPPAEIEVFEDASKSILSRNDSPDLDFTWSLNPYRGCFHACSYCYARPMHEYLGLGAGTDFDRKLMVKPKAPELLAKALRRPSWKGELIVFSGATDCYQPLEAAWRLTRSCLEVCDAHSNPVGIITKSALVARDVDLLARMAERGLASVAMSIPYLDARTSKAIEPGAPAPKRRFEAMRKLADAGVPVGVAVAPIIPGLNDSEIPGILREAQAHGATFAFRILLRLPGSARDVFLRRLEADFPERAKRVQSLLADTREHSNESRFGERFQGSGEYWSMIVRMWDFWTRQLGLDRWSPKRVHAPVDRPAPPPEPLRTDPAQLALFPADPERN